MDNEKWLDVEGTTKGTGSEAPMSIHIDSYYKGFHVGWTKRLDETSLAGQMLGITGFVKQLIEAGFEPSWNADTNAQKRGQDTSGTQGTSQSAQVACSHNNTKVLEVKKEGPNKGRNFKTCLDCKKFMGWV